MSPKQAARPNRDDSGLSVRCLSESFPLPILQSRDLIGDALRYHIHLQKTMLNLSKRHGMRTWPDYHGVLYFPRGIQHTKNEMRCPGSLSERGLRGGIGRVILFHFVTFKIASAARHSSGVR
jgi:hypothetical protein